MKRTVVVLSFALVLASTAVAQSPSAQKPEKLTRQQLASLIASAKTPADHTRIAQFYGAEAQDELAQSKQHEQMAAQFKANPATSSAKFATGTVNHCEYLAQHLKQSAAQAQELEREHKQMAVEAGTE